MQECKELVILGAGGFGREAAFILSEINKQSNRYEILGFIDNDPYLQGKMINNYPVVGNDTWLFNYPAPINVVICIGNSNARKKVVDKFSEKSNIIFPNIIANDVKYSGSVVMGKGCIICFSSILTVDISLGDFVLIMNNSVIGHDSFLDDFVTVYPSVTISGNVSVGKYSEIGVGAKIIQQISIGENAIIGAGAVVVKDIPANCTAVGVPAKPIKIHNSLSS
jgi:sugar O-acyltransferase (sialic acid O-acetyltransferase NeuD family)